MPIQNLVSSEKNNITVAEFIGDKDRLFFDVATRTFRLSDGITPGGIVVNTGGGGGGSYSDFSVDLHLNRATASSGDILSWSGTDYAWIAPGIQTSDLSLTTNSASGGGALTYNSGTGAFAFTPPDLSGFATTGSVSTKIGLSDLSVGAEGSASGDGSLAYDNATGVFTYTPPDLSSLATAASVASKIELTDLSVGAEGIAQGDGAIEYNDATGVFKYTPPDLSSYLTSVAFSDLTSTPTTLAGYGITDAFDGNYNNLTNLPTLFSGAFADLTGKPTTISGYGITDAFDGAFSSLTGKPTTLAGYGITDGYTNSDVDAHLNQTNPTSGYVLSWNGSDYAWVAQSGGGGSQNVFDKIAVSGQNNVEADSTTDTLTFVAGSNMTITTDASTDTITFASTGGGGTTVNPEFTESVTIQSDESTNPVESESSVFYGTSTGNSATRLYRDSSNSSISVPAQTTVFFEADIVGRHDSSTDYGAFKIRGIIDRDGNNNTQMIMNQKETMHAGANELLDANIVADNTGELLAVEVYGESSKTIRWSALIKATSVFQDLTSGGGDPQQNNWYGDRAWATGGRTGLTAGFGGYNNTVHLSIATQSNSTQTQGLFSYPSAVGFQAAGVRGSTCLVVGGSSTGNVSIEDIRSFNCATLGASTSHGSLTNVFTNGEDGWMNNGSLSDGDRCVFQAGFDYQNSTTHLDTIGYVGIENTGNASDFGNLSQARRGTTSSNDSTRGLFVGGEPSATSGSNRIDYVTIQTTGNATDFGDYTYNVRSPASTSDATITIVSGGRWAGSSATMYNTYCGYITIQTPGNASSFGNLQNARRGHMMSSDGTYAVTWGGRESGTPGYADQSEYQVFATQGNATQFADIANYYLYEGGHGSGSSS